MRNIISLISVCFILLFCSMVSAVDIKWDPNPVSDNVTTYTVYWYETDIPIPLYHKNVVANEITLSEDLFKPDIDYSFYVTASNTAGESPKSNIVNAIVRESVSPPIDNIPDPIIINKPATVTITIEVR